MAWQLGRSTDRLWYPVEANHGSQVNGTQVVDTYKQKLMKECELTPVKC